MAKIRSGSIGAMEVTKKKRPGVHSKCKTSRSKNSKHYKHPKLVKPVKLVKAIPSSKNSKSLITRNPKTC